MKTILLFLSLIIFSLAVQVPEGCTGDRNDKPLITEEAKLVKTVQNGKLYTVPYDGRTFYIPVVNGTAYDMGFAYGQLLESELTQMIPATFQWLQNFIETNVTFIHKMPKFLRNMIGTVAVAAAKKLLDLNYLITKKYMPQRYIDEMNGIAKGAKISVKPIRQINYIGEMLKASCSILGVYGEAAKDGNLFHLRSLDWEEHAAISRWPSITVYHPTEEGAVPSANIAWVGYVATLTAYNKEKVGVGERLKGAPWKNETRFGQPWQFVLRDLVHLSKNMEDALNILKNADRTCTIYLGVGSYKEPDFRICEYSYKYLNIYNWETWYHDDKHPKLKDVLWKAYPDGTDCPKNVVMQHYGKIDAEVIYREWAPQTQTGDSQVVVMDYANDILYLGYPNPVTFLPGYFTPILKVDMKKYFDVSILE